MNKTQRFLGIILSCLCALNIPLSIKKESKTYALSNEFTAKARVVEESKLTDLSNWEDVASTKLANEFSREREEVSESYFQMMWDNTALYVLTRTNDSIIDTWDQIEFAFSNGSVNSYFKASMVIDNGTRWTESVGEPLMTSTAISNFDVDGNRYLLTKHTLADSSILATNNKVSVNVIYWSFTGHASICKYSASASASPSEQFTLIGTPSDDNVAQPYTAKARVVEESKLTDLSNWEDVASTKLANEFSREREEVSESYFQMMWDNTALYVLTRTNDSIIDTWDQIEFAFSNGSVNSYFKASMVIDNGTRWTESVGEPLMTSTAISNFDVDGNRYLLTKHTLADSSILATNNKVSVNVIYWSFTGHASICKYSASASASPSEQFTLVGTPIGKTQEELANEAAAKAVEEKINAIPEIITDDNKIIVLEARKAYDALIDAQKELISAALYKKLTDAEQAVINLNYKATAIPNWKADLTDLSIWKDVASNSLTYEFQRAANYTDKINVSFQMIWDYTTLYVLVKTDDKTISETDQMEFAYFNGTEASYFNTSFGGWQAPNGELMTSSQIKAFTDENGYRYILVKSTLVDESVLRTNNSIIINALYRDFTENEKQLCIYSASASASPTIPMLLTGTPSVISEEEKESIKQINDCIDLIVAIPSEITLEDETTIIVAKNAYDALKDEQKAEINSRITDTLNNAVKTLNELKAAKEKEENDKKVANEVIAKIDAIGTVTLESETAINTAREAYEAITADQKAYVSEEKLSALTKAENTLKELKAAKEKEENDKKAANEVIAKIDAIGTVTLASEATINTAKEAYEALTADQKVYVSEEKLSALTTAENTLKELKAAKENKKGCKGNVDGSLALTSLLFVLLLSLKKKKTI